VARPGFASQRSGEVARQSPACFAKALALISPKAGAMPANDLIDSFAPLTSFLRKMPDQVELLAPLLEEFDPAIAGGEPTRARSIRPISATFIREATDEDLASKAIAKPQSPLMRIKFQHHGIARRVALGHSPAQISLETGYSPSHIVSLLDDPTFSELVKFYAAQVAQIFVDAAERMKNLGIAALEELQSRIDDKPEEWSRAELRDLAETMLVKPMLAQAKGGAQVFGGAASGGGLAINVRFINAPLADSRPIVEGEIIPPESET